MVSWNCNRAPTPDGAMKSVTRKLGRAMVLMFQEVSRWPIGSEAEIPFDYQLVHELENPCAIALSPEALQIMRGRPSAMHAARVLC